MPNIKSAKKRMRSNAKKATVNTFITSSMRTAVKNFEKEVAEEYPNADKDTTVVLLSRFYDNEKRYHQYFFAFKKI